MYKTMETCCVICKKNTANENSIVKKTKQNGLIFSVNYCLWLSNDQFKMNKITNKFLLTGDKFMPELHLKEPGFSACGPFTKRCERIQKFRETGNLKHL